MFNFNFYNPTKIIFGKDRLKELSKLVPTNARVLILFGGGSAKKYGTIDKVTAALEGRTVLEFSGIEPNPQYETLMKAVNLVREQNIDFLLAVGGGSVMDGTKFVAAAALYEDEPWKIFKLGAKANVRKALPLGTVVTLPATGSEMNSGGVISYEKGKFAFFNPLVFPHFSILDPTLTFTLPRHQVANGVVDAFIHVAEQYMTYPVEGSIQDRLAEGILKTLIEVGPKTVAEPEDYDARANLMWSASLALNGLIGAGVPQDWATHMIGHELTALFGIDHGQSLAIVYPSLLTECSEQKRAKLLQYGRRVWHITGGDEDSRINLAIEKTRQFFEGLGVKTRLSDYGVKPDQIDDVIKALEAHGMTALSESKGITLEVSRKILEGAI